LKTAVVEKDPFLGGTCLHVGCIPTKVFLHHADIYDNFKRAAEFGFEVKDVKVNWPAMLTRKDKIVKKHAGGIAALFKKNKVDSITGWGRVAGPGRVSVEKDGKTTELETTYTMLATGSEARSLPGVEIDGTTILTNREILALQSIPKSLVVVGCGAVGVEFASVFHTFGSEVTLLEALPRVVPLEDEEVSAELEKSFRKKGIKIELEAKVSSVTKDANGATVSYTDKSGSPKTISAEKVLIAVGRRPLTENIGLEKTKAKVERGFVHTNAFLETPPPWKASSPLDAWRANQCNPSTANAAPTPPTASRRLAPSA
jgi:dihydrolipoamide dehydrogenase